LRLRALAAALLAATVLIGTSAAAVPPDPLRIMTIGDSLNTGLGSMDGCGYRTQLDRDLTAAGVAHVFTGAQNGTGPLDCPIRYGHHGATLANLQTSVVGWMAADAPDVVLIQVGTNDATGSVDGYQARYRTLLQTILSANSTVKVAAGYMPYRVTQPGEPTSWATNQPSLNVQIIMATLNAQTAYPGRVTLVNASKLPCRFRADGVHPDYYDPVGRWYYDGIASLYGLPLSPANSLFYPDQAMPGIHRPATSCPT